MRRQFLEKNVSNNELIIVKIHSFPNHYIFEYYQAKYMYDIVESLLSYDKAILSNITICDKVEIIETDFFHEHYKNLLEESYKEIDVFRFNSLFKSILLCPPQKFYNI
jgi:hypothetical protein